MDGDRVRRTERIQVPRGKGRREREEGAKKVKKEGKQGREEGRKEGRKQTQLCRRTRAHSPLAPLIGSDELTRETIIRNTQRSPEHAAKGRPSLISPR